MTNELEKQFFDTFGIEPYDRYLNCPENLEGECKENCNYCDKAEDVYYYPEITDSILLELICIHIKYLTFGILSHNVEKLKNEILTDLRIKKDVGNIYNEVRTLFEEEN